MPDREKYIDIFKQIVKAKKKYYRNDDVPIRISYQCVVDILYLLKEQEAQKFFVDESGKITPLPVVVRCKDCKHRPIKPNDYENGFDLEFPDGKCPCQCDDGWYSWYPPDDWFCANGERR